MKVFAILAALAATASAQYGYQQPGYGMGYPGYQQPGYGMGYPGYQQAGYGMGYPGYGMGGGYGMNGYQFAGYSRYGQAIIADPQNPPGPAPNAVWFSAYGTSGSDGWSTPQWEVPEWNPYWGDWEYNSDNVDYPYYGGMGGYGGMYQG